LNRPALQCRWRRSREYTRESLIRIWRNIKSWRMPRPQGSHTRRSCATTRVHRVRQSAPQAAGMSCSTVILAPRAARTHGDRCWNTAGAWSARGARTRVTARSINNAGQSDILPVVFADTESLARGQARPHRRAASASYTA
jgi:hypothetical protein